MFFPAGGGRPANHRQLLILAGDIELNPGPRRSDRIAAQKLRSKQETSQLQQKRSSNQQKNDGEANLSNSDEDEFWTNLSSTQNPPNIDLTEQADQIAEFYDKSKYAQQDKLSRKKRSSTKQPDTNEPNKVKIGVWNAGGLKNKKDVLENWSHKNSIDILVLQESQIGK